MAGLAIAALLLSGCETTAEKSAKLARQAKHVTLSEKGLSITRESAYVKVVSSTLVHSSEAAAAVVKLRNGSMHTLRAIPIAITVRDASGRSLFQNNAPGLEGALVAVASLAPHATTTWIDDQVPPNGGPASASARVGEGSVVQGRIPSLATSKISLSEDPTSGIVATGTVTNHSSISQRNLVLFGLARRGGKIVAAGRGMLPVLAGGASAPFQVSFVGDASAAQVQVLVPPTTFG